jgi:hypothetical protein
MTRPSTHHDPANAAALHAASVELSAALDQLGAGADPHAVEQRIAVHQQTLLRQIRANFGLPDVARPALRRRPARSRPLPGLTRDPEPDPFSSRAPTSAERSSLRLLTAPGKAAAAGAPKREEGKQGHTRRSTPRGSLRTNHGLWLPGVVTVLGPELRGVDSLAPLDATRARRLRAAGWTFVARYIRSAAPEPRAPSLEVDEARHILAADLALMLVQHPRDFSRRKPSARLGRLDGQAALAWARVLGYPRGASIWLDLASLEHASRDQLSDYALAWFERVSGAGWRPGCRVGPGGAPIERTPLWRSGRDVTGRGQAAPALIDTGRFHLDGLELGAHMTTGVAAALDVTCLQPRSWAPVRAA